MNDTQKLYMVIGFLKGVMTNGEFYATLNVKEAKKLLVSLGVKD